MGERTRDVTACVRCGNSRHRMCGGASIESRSGTARTDAHASAWTWQDGMPPRRANGTRRCEGLPVCTGGDCLVMSVTEWGNRSRPSKPVWVEGATIPLVEHDLKPHLEQGASVSSGASRPALQANDSAVAGWNRVGISADRSVRRRNRGGQPGGAGGLGSRGERCKGACRVRHEQLSRNRAKDQAYKIMSIEQPGAGSGAIPRSDPFTCARAS